MGRTYFVEEAIGQYLLDLGSTVKPYVTGLLIGQVSVECLKSVPFMNSVLNQLG